MAKKKRKNYKHKDPWGVEIFVTCDRSRISRLAILKTNGEKHEDSEIKMDRTVTGNESKNN